MQLILPPLSLYIHIPWCVQKCPYCDFNSHAQKGIIPEAEYIEHLLADLSQDLIAYKEAIGERKIYSIFIGGGTPSLFSAEGIGHLLSEIQKRIPFEQGLEITEALVRSGAVDLIVVDSVAALTPKVEIDGEMTDAHVGVHARLMSKALRKLTSSISKTRTVIIFINQLREKVGVMFGNPETTTGGRALKFYSTIRLDVRKGEALTSAKEHVGNRTKVKVVKNKVAPPFKVAEFDLMFGEGVSYEGTLIDIGANIEVIKKSGAWYSYNGERMGQGKEAAKVFLKENPQIAQEIDAIIRDTLAAEPLNVLGHDEEVDEVATTETVDME